MMKESAAPCRCKEACEMIEEGGITIATAISGL